ncbi:Arylsulfatase [Pirellulimonas nuda]|uniref:Arylsulfatase n=1 Tax=Pirellulimonas nuda TaxID=2528009 RepID=A0A518DCL2_9BACT|nr:sulfatase-like hydrolase/transferase [Pirellulimonas nuda]QDU89209.1 Arylsulfatase [Pirellulimonas nuda]
MPVLLRSCCLSGLLLLLAGFAAAQPQGTEDRRPNVLFILTDDQCWEALGCTGGEVETPNLDRLAASGTLFTRAYNMGSWSGAVCMPSRTMLITGRKLWNVYPIDQQLVARQRKKAAQAPGKPIDTGTAWPEWFSQAGYRTYFAGKWHTNFHKAEDVFDVVGTVRPGMPADTPEGYNRPKSPDDDRWQPWDKQRGGFWEGGTHWSEVLRDEAIGFLKQGAERPEPFFMYLAFNAPHDPRQSPREYVQRYPASKIRTPENFLPEYPYKDQIECGRSLRDERLAPFPRTEYAVQVNRSEYYALVTHLDDQIGAVLEALRASGQADNTFVLLTSDHGLALGRHGLMGKQNVFEHSLRAPLIVAGPGLPRGGRSDARVFLQDVVPTSLEAAGIPVPEEIEFESLLPLIRGEAGARDDSMYAAYRMSQRMAIRGDWKIIYYTNVPKHLLFNLADDPLEMHDLADRPEHAAKLAEMKQALRDDMRQNNDPLKQPQG